MSLFKFPVNFLSKHVLGLAPGGQLIYMSEKQPPMVNG